MMDVLKWVPLLILVVLILILLIGNIVIVQQSKAYVVERLGAFRTVWGVGLHLKVPFVERVAKKVSLKEQVADFAPQPVITKDNVTMQIDTVIYFQITDPKLYTYGVERPMNAIENLTATTLRNIIGEMELDQSLTSRDTINAKMRAILDEATDPWGIKVNRVELKNIIPPKEIQNAMEKQMKAERERRESILQAEGQKQSQILVAEGEKQSLILKADAAKQAAILKAEGEKEARIMAAEAAAGDGLRVMLVESRGFLGGNLTIGLPILGFLGRKGNQIIEGSAQRFIDRLRARGAASEHRPCALHMSLTIIDPEEAKRTALEIMEEKGVEVLLYTFFADAIREGDAVKGVVVESKAGREAILARTVIDCTGDGDVAFRAGVECRKGDAEGGMQPPTLMFCMKGVDVQRLRDAIVQHPDVYDMDTMPAEQFRTGKFITVGLRNQIEQARAKGIHIPVARTILITGLADDEIWVNMTRVNGVDSTRPESYTHGEIEGRKQVYEVERYLREFVPGFADARIEKVAPFMGIRESRVIVGRYVLTAEDIIACRRFGDAIAVAGYPVDIHHAKGGDCTMHFCDDSYDIPYRCLLPERVAGLLVAGRCSSMNHEAMASTRVMSTCMALGEAAGRAARLALKAGVQPADLDVEALRAELRATGAYLG